MNEETTKPTKLSKVEMVALANGDIMFTHVIDGELVNAGKFKFIDEVQETIFKDLEKANF